MGGAPTVRADAHLHDHLHARHDGWHRRNTLSDICFFRAEIRNATVRKIEPRADGLFDVSVPNQVITARTIVLATGLMDELPPLTGLRKVWGRDLHIRPCFDGGEFRNQRFVVFGLPGRLAQLGARVSMWSPHVAVVTQHPFDANSAERLP